MKTSTDEELVRMYISTQQNVYFEQLYGRYCDKVYRKCLSFTKEPMKAEDFTHDIFLRLIVKLGSFKEQSKFSTWLYSITYNYCTDQLRTPQKKAEVYMDEGWERVGDTLSDDDESELAEMAASDVRKAMEKLSPEERSLLMMKYQDDVSIREIAQVYNLTESAVKMRLKRSREKLRKYYLEGAVMWLLVALKMLLSLRWPGR
jgi:RNA polymerase sigma factor (sigma-70 family)